MEQQNRQLAAILFTDIVGYTAMMQKDEQNALAVTRHYIAVLKQSTEEFHGRILNDYGDGTLCWNVLSGDKEILPSNYYTA